MALNLPALPALPATLLCESLDADLLPRTPMSSARHYDVSRHGELVGRISYRLGGTNPSPGWWVYVADGHYLLHLNDDDKQPVYFPTPQDALAALNEHMKRWEAEAIASPDDPDDPDERNDA